MKVVGYVIGGKTRLAHGAVRHVVQQLGGEVHDRRHPVDDADLIVVWGYKKNRLETAHAIARGIPVLVLENVAWGRGKGQAKCETFSLGFNGLQGGSWLPDFPEVSRTHPELAPMREDDGGRITIFGQVVGDAALRDADNEIWLTEMERQYQADYPNREVVVRRHPLMSPSWERQEETLEECFERTSRAVTFSSTTGAEALIAGIPTDVEHWGSFAWPVAQGHLTREEWIHQMSWRHWSQHEPIDTDWLLSGYEQAREQARQGEYDVRLDIR